MKKIIRLTILDFVDMRKIYAAFLDCFKELAAEMQVCLKKDSNQTIAVNRICESILRLEKFSKFIEIYEMLEDFSDFFENKIYLVK